MNSPATPIWTCITTTVSSAAELEIDLAAIVDNWSLLGTLHPSGPVAAVLKADAYGLGAEQVGPALAEAGCRHFFVAHLTEAIALRRVVPAGMIGVLNGLWPGDAAHYREHALLPVLGSLAEIDAWQGPALLHLDTGMNRLGLDEASVDALRDDPARLRSIELRYLMTHLISAETADPSNERQRQAFDALCLRLGRPELPRSLANSSGIFLGSRFGSDLARPGAALYGVNPTPGRPNPMRAAVRLRARILQTRRLRPGDSVGYNGHWTAGRDSVIGVCSVGYADGWLRALTNRGEARFDGERVPLVGRVSMDLTTFDLTGTRARAGDWLDLIGPDVPVDAVARLAGTNGYEILTDLGRRYGRVYRPA